MTGYVDITYLHNLLVQGLVDKNLIQSKSVQAAFEAIPRHLFLPDVSPEEIYQDKAIPTRYDDEGIPISSSSQPAIMAIMLEQLGLEPGQNVLEIGAGTGYNAALMGYIVGNEGHITTLDFDKGITFEARKHLEAAVCENVTVVCADGMDGFAENAPYDAIILTVGGWEIAPAWLDQLKSTGRILLPLSLRGPQLSIAFDRIEHGLISVSIAPCGFMRLRGPNAGPLTAIPINKNQTSYLGFEEIDGESHQLVAKQVVRWLASPQKDFNTGIIIEPRSIWQSFQYWLALQEPKIANLSAMDEALKEIPVLMGGTGDQKRGMSIGLLGKKGMAFFFRPVEWKPPDLMGREEPVPFELGIRSYGNADLLVGQLQKVAKLWDENGRSGIKEMRIRVFPIEYGEETPVMISRRWHKFLFDWPEKEINF